DRVELLLRRFRREIIVERVVDLDRVEVRPFRELEHLAQTHEAGIGESPGIDRLLHVVALARSGERPRSRWRDAAVRRVSLLLVDTRERRARVRGTRRRRSSSAERGSRRAGAEKCRVAKPVAAIEDALPEKISWIHTTLLRAFR